jgi:hypothetical protein
LKSVDAHTSDEGCAEFITTLPDLLERGPSAVVIVAVEEGSG